MTQQIPFKQEIEDTICEKIVSLSPLNSSMSRVSKVMTEQNSYVIKHLDEVATNRFTCEADGIKEIEDSNTISVPEVLEANEHFIIMSFINTSLPSSSFFKSFGQKLAQMHHHHSEIPGFKSDNYIGSTPQANDNKDELPWPQFYWEKRLLFQYKIALDKGLLHDKIASDFLKIRPIVIDLLSQEKSPPSLLHGDLWSGNFLSGESGNPYLIDPAVYYGSREADLAMTKLFGGFPKEFYLSYAQEFPLCPGSEERVPLYQLYHLLNHLNIFGRSYLEQVAKVVADYSH